MVPSCRATSTWPSSATHTEAGSGRSSTVRRHAPVRALHSLITAPSTVTSTVLFFAVRSDVTLAPTPSRVFTTRPVRRSHSLMVSSNDDVSARMPSDVSVTAVISCVCPERRSKRTPPGGVRHSMEGISAWWNRQKTRVGLAVFRFAALSSFVVSV